MAADPNRVILTGENPFIRLSAAAAGPQTTNASFWRIIACPKGPGHVLYLKSELTDDRWRIYSDNIAMARWLQATVQGMLNPETADTAIAVTEAEFVKSGDPHYFWTERVVSSDEDISLTWYDIGDPMLIHTQPNEGGRRYGVCSLLIPALGARLSIDGSDAAACDDSDLRNIVHCGTPLTATSLAIAERTGAGGGDVLAAIVLGYEAAGRIGEAITPGFRAQGFHGCLVAIFAAAVAAARLLRLAADRMAQAIALSATSIGGLAAAANTSVAREYHAGLAAKLGIDAALAAERGFKAEPGILEARHGFFAVYGEVDPAIAAAGVLRDLGQSWDIVTDMAVKLVPGGHPHHALAEAAANAAREGGFAAAEIDSITLSRPGVTALAEPLHPADLIGMAHSPAYFLAAGAADRGFSWVHATPAKIADPAIHRLIDKVRVGPPPAADAARYRQGATVTIRSRDGRSAASTVYAPKGAGILGIAWADIDAKYRVLVPHARLSGERIEASLALIHDFRGVERASALTDLLAAAPGTAP